MTKDMMISGFIFIVALVWCWVDLQGEKRINHWLTYAIVGMSIGIWMLFMMNPNPVRPTVWLQRVLDPWVPMMK